MDLAIEAFNKYVKQFDFTIIPIKEKYEHTIRVVKYCHNIALSLNMNDEEIELAMICGLFHDVSRFKQYTEYHTYIDKNSFEHGDESYKIFVENNFDLLLSEKKYQIIKKAIKEHNKLSPQTFDEETNKYINIVRDADKLDIMMTQYISDCPDIFSLTEEVYQSIMNHQLLLNNELKEPWYCYFRHLAFIFDMNYKYSLEYLVKQDLINKKLSLVHVEDNSLEKIENIKKEINKYMEAKIC